MTQVNLAEEVWSEETLAEVLGITREQLVSLVKDKNLPTVRLGHAKVFLAESILKWLKENEKSGKMFKRPENQ
jgi:predicted DNA-binding transcriptional regulator AlpA